MLMKKLHSVSILTEGGTPVSASPSLAGVPSTQMLMQIFGEKKIDYEVGV
jgi:hypothetical protein